MIAPAWPIVLPGGAVKPAMYAITGFVTSVSMKAAAFIEEKLTKPVVAYIAGFTAPPGKTMGHAGAIISGSSGTAQGKKDALEAKGIRVGTTPTETAELVAAIAK